MTDSSKNLFGSLGLSKEPETEEVSKGIATEADTGEPTMEVSEDETAPPVVEEPEDEKPDELTFLKSRAQMMGISFSNNIGLEALRAKIDAKLNGEPEVKPVVAVAQPEPAVTGAPVVKVKKPKTLRQHIHDENMRLIRIRLTNLDEKDKDLNGQYYTVANEFLGTVTRFIPFQEAADNGWHVPYCLLKFLKAQKFLQIRIINPNRQNERVETKWVRKFAIEELAPLTPDEMAKLAATQSATRATDDD